VVAAALMDGKIDLDSFQNAALNRMDLLDFGEKKIFPFVDETMNKDSNKSITKTNIELILKDGGILKKSIPFAKGSKEKPMNMQECEQKFRMCLKKSTRPLADQDIKKAIEKIVNFEKLSDVRELYTILC
jgi:2-methylcitrate dehydratase PrpD